jgi:UDPglucose 6-dehydrogenase
MRIDVYGDTLCASVTAGMLASTGHEVRWLVPAGRVWQSLKEGDSAYREPGLRDLLNEQRRSGRLDCALLDDPETDFAPAEMVFLALQPGSLELAHGVTRAIAGDTTCRVLVNQSVFPVGTTEELQASLHAADSCSRVVSLPDVLQEGAALTSFMRPGNILLGCDDDGAEELLREVLRPFNRRRDVIQVMRPREAEFTKLAISGMLATRLSYMNDMALLAEQLDVDIDRVRQGMGADSRIGEAYLYAGCGFGGPGFSRDVMSLTQALHRQAASAGLLEEVLEVNERQKEVLFRRFWQYFGGEVAGREVALWGVAFKPGSDRVDNAPALKLIEALAAQDVTIRVHDPLALPELRAWAGEGMPLEFCEDPYEAVRNVDALMLVTEWKLYWSPDWSELRESMLTPLILDGRNIYDPAFVRNRGLLYQGVGRG